MKSQRLLIEPTQQASPRSLVLLCTVAWLSVQLLSTSARAAYLELRIYTVTSNRMEGVLERFRDIVEPVRRKHGIDTLGYWSSPGTTNGGTFAYLLSATRKEDLENREKEFGADPQFQSGYVASQAKHGKTVDRIVTLSLRATEDRSFRLTQNEGATPHAFDLRVYSVPTEKLGAFRDRWIDFAVPIYERHGLRSLGWWMAESRDSEGNEQFVCLLTGPSLEAIQHSITEFHKDPAWQRIEKETEVHGKLRSGVIAYKLLPTDFSRLK